jgi:hypothetical protein
LGTNHPTGHLLANTLVSGVRNILVSGVRNILVSGVYRLLGGVSNNLVSQLGPAARPPTNLEIVHKLPKTVEIRIVQPPHGITTRTRHGIENLIPFLTLNSVEPPKPPA